MVKDVLDKGVILLFGGILVIENNIYFFILLIYVMLEMWVFCEEIFGFVLFVVKFFYEVDVIVMVNDIEYGLVVYFYV